MNLVATRLLISLFSWFCTLILLANPGSSFSSTVADTIPELIGSDRAIRFDANEKIVSKSNNKSIINSTVSTSSCSDLVSYPIAKATGLQGININNATSAHTVAQYFDAPQTLEISGFDFYAYKLDATGGISINLTAKIYLAGPDSLPTGSALATVLVTVDTTFGDGNLLTLLKTATFSSPVVVNQAYCLVVENLTSTGVAVVFNSWTAGDGQSEWLSSAIVGNSWIRSYNLNIGGIALDADALFHPYVHYEVNASFTPSTTSFSSPTTVDFTNESSPIFENRMYNQAAFLGLSELSYTWDFSDGSPRVNGQNTMHLFDPDCYQVILLDTLFGWQSTCTVQDTAHLNYGPVTDFSFSASCPSLTIAFSDLSEKTPTQWLWDFGDGNISTQQNTSHTYFGEGTYTVCLTTVNDFDADSSCAFVIVEKDIFGTCCPTTLTISENPINSGTYTAQNTISASTSAMSDIIFKAGEEILLDPNFEITLGATLDALIESCAMDL